jgi:hypothetical protein
MHRWVVAAAIALGTSGHACAQTPGYYDTRDAFYAAAPPGYYLPPPVIFAPSWYFSRPVDPYLPRTGYLPPPMRIDVSPGLVEVMPPRPRSCGRYRYWNGEYCADARFERPYLGPKW